MNLDASASEGSIPLVVPLTYMPLLMLLFVILLTLNLLVMLLI
jgi:hypothetical protein